VQLYETRRDMIRGFKPKMSLAAAICTCCSNRMMVVSGKAASTELQ